MLVNECNYKPGCDGGMSTRGITASAVRKEATFEEDALTTADARKLKISDGLELKQTLTPTSVQKRRQNFKRRKPLSRDEAIGKTH